MKLIFDVCCGARMFWFNKSNPLTVFMDNRECEDTLCDGRKFIVKPDVIGDFRNIPFNDNTFQLVVFDPPHLIKAGEKSWLVKKYGRLNPDTYKDDLKQGFRECFRVLKPNGILVFKWNETDMAVSEIIKLSPVEPLFGHKSGKQNKTNWLVFMKEGKILKNTSKEKVTVSMFSSTELNEVKKLLEDNGYEVHTVPLSFDEADLIKYKVDGVI